MSEYDTMYSTMKMPQKENLPNKDPNLEEVKPRTVGKETGDMKPPEQGNLELDLPQNIRMQENTLHLD